MSYADNLSGQFGQLGIGGSQSQPYQSPPPPGSGQHGQYGYHSANRDDVPPAQFIASPPLPTYQPPSDKPPIPQGWTPLFDQSRQRWYYANKETGATQWEAPGYVAPPQRPPMETYPSEESRGSGSSPYPPAAPYGHTPGGYGAPPPGPPPSASYGAPPVPPAGYGAPGAPPGGYGHSSQGSYGGEGREEKKKSSGKSGMLLGAAGGVAAGLVGGALLHHVLEDDRSDEEERRRYDEEERRRYDYDEQPSQTIIVDERPSETIIVNEYNTTTYNDSYDDPYRESGAPGILPSRDAEGNYVSESDRESVEEARERYEAALADVEDSSSASSSDYEELAEAREEYEEEYEETYDD